MGRRAIGEARARRLSAMQTSNPLEVVESPRRDGLEQHQEKRPASPAAAPLFSAAGISKTWRGQPEPVIDDVDLELAPGECVWIGGRNGAGKTTLLRIFSALITPDTGGVRLGGLDPERERRRYQLRLGFLTAGNAGLTARLSARYHLRYWARLALVPTAEIEPAIERTLEAFSLRELASRRVDRLSTGQRQRLRVAMAFLHSPDLVLLDEPVASLDAEGIETVAAAVREVTARDGAAVFCSPADRDPDLDCDRHFVIDAGSLVKA
ncbi:MAG: ATP-binding cassette domain-containing protein [Solirubrobacterales bacterium]